MKLLNACVLLKVVPTKAEAILEAIRGLKGVRRTYFTYGRFDIATFVEVEDYRTLRNITSQINSLDGVRSTETLAEA